MNLDELDKRIVTVLERNARATYATIGDEVGLSAPAIKRRIDRLVAGGTIRGFTARVDPALFGTATEAYVELHCDRYMSSAALTAIAARYPEVVSACTVAGDAGALLHVRASDIEHFERVLERIGAEDSVVRTRSVIVLSRVVDRVQPVTERPRAEHATDRRDAQQRTVGTRRRAF
ncbi:Lrp/AsnC family transcriptional regulator [Actinomadura sp. 6N118]|uniref:Lrp/AsnC family transcriptional regulator n=1 Tax=Actinomadura sp. 6N118 TaxID=3375151 RepID=UPI0037AD2A8D